MKHFQDTETGLIHAFEDDVDPRALNNRNIPTSLSETIKPKPSDSHVWYLGGWIKQEDAPPGYTPPTSSVPSYNPAWMAYLLPYTAVHRDQASSLNISIDQINTNSYEGNKLAEVVATLPLGTPSGIPALISYDGAIAIPQCEDFPSNTDGIKKLNEILCSLLLGGIHTEVLHSNSLVVGSLQDRVRLFAYTPSLHSQLRLNWAAIGDRLSPLMHPRVLMVIEIQKAYSQGQQVIRAIHNFSPFFLLNGYTAMVYRNNSDALNNLWIAVEQLTEYLWAENYVKNRNAFPRRVAKCHSYVKKAIDRDQIWAKQQLLRLAKIISKECHKALCLARGQRNDLVHSGKRCPNCSNRLQVFRHWGRENFWELTQSAGRYPQGLISTRGRSLLLGYRVAIRAMFMSVMGRHRTYTLRAMAEYQPFYHNSFVEPSWRSAYRSGVKRSLTIGCPVYFSDAHVSSSPVNTPQTPSCSSDRFDATSG